MAMLFFSDRQITVVYMLRTISYEKHNPVKLNTFIYDNPFEKKKPAKSFLILRAFFKLLFILF